ncbi:uncharacterized protein F5Z01DRAFT_631473 [Emericellopsis atlantica]|uniref:Uncharacterized protein n=1 Tax=Emericellopsis atlantica TaxID=2614577 RepID=A0A9P7ZCI1_9HYPO|nr:uncharacterized protein F5Z01DRAFT_631473 [Emericellopsis atlantica]KAG9249559.1 hypothetical protein F5Z01DRAFT_631473 [Emericellopsis atlantica]
MATGGESPNLPPSSSQPPPPASQSYFATLDHFTPDESASFDREFGRLASSQEWVPGSQEYTRERTVAMREELTSLYFTPPTMASNNKQPEPLTDEQKLKGYQDLCDEIGISPADSIDECKKHLKSTLVNIVDLIDARRTGSAAMVWQDLDAFRTYTLQDEHRINKDEAKEGEGLLASLLQNFRLPRRHKRIRAKRDAVVHSVTTGRVGKKSQR